jgi:hypothetical protein
MTEQATNGSGAPEKVVIGGHELLRLSEGEYEGVDRANGLDFHFTVLDEPEEGDEFTYQVVIDIFDIHKARADEAHVETFEAADLKEAVESAFNYFTSVDHSGCDLSATHAGGRKPRASAEPPRSAFASDEAVAQLRDIADVLEAAVGSGERSVFFPNWDDSDDRTELIREAARTVWASYDPAGDGGGYTSKRALSALVHHVADMLEE